MDGLLEPYRVDFYNGSRTPWSFRLITRVTDAERVPVMEYKGPHRSGERQPRRFPAVSLPPFQTSAVHAVSLTARGVKFHSTARQISLSTPCSDVPLSG